MRIKYFMTSIFLVCICACGLKGTVESSTVAPAANSNTEVNQPEESTKTSNTSKEEPPPQSTDETDPTSADAPIVPVDNNPPAHQDAPVQKDKVPSEKNDIPDSEVKVSPSSDKNLSGNQATSLEGARSVVGLARDGESSDRLLDQGYISAVFEARVCRTTGHFSNGSKCFVMYSDGHFENVTLENRKELDLFIEVLVSKTKKKN